VSVHILPFLQTNQDVSRQFFMLPCWRSIEDRLSRPMFCGACTSDFKMVVLHFPRGGKLRCMEQYLGIGFQFVLFILCGLMT